MAKAKTVADETVRKVVSIDLGDTETSTKANSGVWVPILHPISEEETDTEFLVQGYDSDEYVAWRDAQSKKSQRYFIAGLAAAKKGKTIEDSEILDGVDSDVSLLTKLVKDWKNVRWNGDMLEFNTENLQKVLRKNAVVRTQLRRAVDERERFFQKPSET